MKYYYFILFLDFLFIFQNFILITDQIGYP